MNVIVLPGDCKHLVGKKARGYTDGKAGIEDRFSAASSENNLFYSKYTQSVCGWGF